jgi:hypothetical protein
MEEPGTSRRGFGLLEVALAESSVLLQLVWLLAKLALREPGGSGSGSTTGYVRLSLLVHGLPLTRL